MQVLHVTHPSSFDHHTGEYHPERPARLKAATQGVHSAVVDTMDVIAVPVEAEELTIVHDPFYVEAVARFISTGGGDLDPDTRTSEGSWEAALGAAGAGPTAVDHLANGFDGPAFITVRPPGHHALRDRAMGFCLFNNVAVTAARLRNQSQRVAILDWDVHHGNGTQAIFYADPDVLYVSLHQSPFYPFEGMASEVGEGEGTGATVNIPLPAFTAGDVYRQAFEDLALPALTAFRPDWLLISSGFDAHARDPLAELRLVESDYHFLGATLRSILPANRIVAFLEGGYHLPAIRDSVTAVIDGLTGHPFDGEPSEHRSSPEAQRTLERLRPVLRGSVPGIQ